MDLRQKNEMKKILAEKAELFKAIAHPVRLCILTLLMLEEKSNVTDMQRCIDVSQSTVSQHLSRLRTAGIIAGRREGAEIYYSVQNGYIRNLISSIVDQITSIEVEQ